jgi:hypothetical protein
MPPEGIVTINEASRMVNTITTAAATWMTRPNRAA